MIILLREVLLKGIQYFVCSFPVRGLHTIGIQTVLYPHQHEYTYVHPVPVCVYKKEQECCIEITDCNYLPDDVRACCGTFDERVRICIKPLDVCIGFLYQCCSG